MSVYKKISSFSFWFFSFLVFRPSNWIRHMFLKLQKINHSMHIVEFSVNLLAMIPSNTHLQSWLELARTYLHILSDDRIESRWW